MLKYDNLLLQQKRITLKHKTHFGHNILSSYLVINVIMWYWSTFYFYGSIYFWQQHASENNSNETIWTLLQSWYWISGTSNESVNRPHHNCLGFRDEYKGNKQISLCVHYFLLGVAILWRGGLKGSISLRNVFSAHTLRIEAWDSKLDSW